MSPRKSPPDWALALLLLAAVYLWQRTTFPLWMTDLLPVQIAAFQWKSGDIDWIYAPADRYSEWHAHTETVALRLGGEGFGNPYFLPPFVAAALSPFSEIRATTWRNTLFAVNLGLTLSLAWLTVRLCRVTLTLRSFLWALALVLIAFPTSRATHLGQLLPALVVLAWLGLLWLRDRRHSAAAVALGLVSAIKLFPFGLIALPAVARRFRALWTWLTVVVGIYAISILSLGLRVHDLFWEAARQFGSRIYPFYGNQSLVGWYVRLFRDRDLWEITPYTDPGLEAAYAIIAASLAAVTLLWMWIHRRGLSSAGFPAFAGLLIAGLLLAIANAWDHYWMFQIPVIGWALQQEWSRGSRFAMLWVLAAGFLCLMKLTHFYTDGMFGRFTSGSQTAGMMMLWFYLAWRVRDFAARVDTKPA